MFFSFSSPHFDLIGQDLFSGVKKSYGEEVLEAIKNIAKKCEKPLLAQVEDCAGQVEEGLWDKQH